MAQLQTIDPLRIGVVVGSSRGPVEVNHLLGARTPKRPTDSLYISFSSISGVIASALQIQGCSLMSSATCISGAAALKTGMAMIHSGELDIVLAGGVDAPLVDPLLEQYAATGVLATDVGPQALQPFARTRTGTVLGEGSAFVVLESEASALRRGVPIRGLIHHVAVGCDFGSRAGTNTGEALRQTTERALLAMKTTSQEIDLLHLHGTGTQLNDAMESRCVQSIFGPEKYQPHSWASKGVTGHTLGASALFQVVLTLEALGQSFLPGSANSTDPDPACPLRLQRGLGAKMSLRKALCLTSGFWGNTSCIGLSLP